jgi:hypothetical protein
MARARCACRERVAMARSLTMLLAGAMLMFGIGCASAPLIDIPDLMPGEKVTILEQNPFYVPLGPQKEAYAKVFESILQMLGDYGFEILEADRISGRVETVPRIAPGVGLFLKPGSPALDERILATLQTYRHRISVRIDTADNGGYFIEVIARKELQDLPRPIKQTAGAAIFRTYNTVERQFEVIDATYFESGWIYKGRDPALEQKLIRSLKKHI